VVAKFDQRQGSSDGGAILLQAAEWRLGLTSALAACLRDDRQPGKVQHALSELLTQRVMAIAVGYEDANDAARLASDPIHKLLVGRDPLDGEDLASQPTLSRFENAPDRKELLRMSEALADCVMERHRKRLHGRARRITIDLDPTDDPTHGQQQFTFFNSHCDSYCYLPVVAKDATADKPKWSQAHLLLAQTYFGTVAMAVRAIAPPRAEDRETNLANSLAAADDAISIAVTEGNSYANAQALALKSDIALIQGRKEDAARFARESFAANPTDLQGRLAMGQVPVSMGNLDEGIRILEEAYARADYAPHVSFMLGQALMARGSEPDVSRAIEVFSSAKLENLDRELIDPVIVSAIRAMVRAKRFTEVPHYATRAEVAASPMLVAIIGAHAALKQSHNIEADKLLVDAIASRQRTDSCSATDFLARTLMDARRLSDALPLLQELFDAQTPNFDVDLIVKLCSAPQTRQGDFGHLSGAIRTRRPRMGLGGLRVPISGGVRLS
jgi:tetratricopeptide (TPR) repeat protein